MKLDHLYLIMTDKKVYPDYLSISGKKYTHADFDRDVKFSWKIRKRKGIIEFWRYPEKKAKGWIELDNFDNFLVKEIL